MAESDGGFRGLDEEMADRNVLPWDWGYRPRREELTTEAIGKLFDPTQFPRLAQAATAAFCAAAGTPADGTAEALHGFVPKPTPCPDLLLTRSDGHVVFVVEVKRGARAQVTGLGRFPYDDLAARFADQRSRDLRPVPGLKEWHVAEDNAECPCWAHTGPRDGMRQGGLFQIDVYRYWANWVPSGYSLSDPMQVRWILLDEFDRTPKEAFPEAFSADLWEAGSLGVFARQLVPVYDKLQVSEGRDLLEISLRMLAS
jgi:hypothetical protein